MQEHWAEYTSPESPFIAQTPPTANHNSKNDTRKPENIALVISNHLYTDTGTPIHSSQSHHKRIYMPLEI